MDVTGIRGETERLVLRTYRDDDAPGLLAIYPDERAVQYVPFPRLEGEALERAMGRRTQPAFENDDDRLFFVAEDKQTGASIAEFGIFLRSTTHQTAEFGYGVHPEWAGRGLATEGGRAMMALGFETFGMHRMIGCLDARNAASVAVMTKLGMRREALHVAATLNKGEWTDDVIFAMLADEWAGAGGVSWTL